ncbi:MAG: hypothetical protein KC615_07255, partial [Anaerolineae bacterium]|nr:hypothetical protein [Anaerolineae bacterium]
MSNIKSLKDKGQRRGNTGALPQLDKRPITGELIHDGWAPPSLRTLEDTGLTKLAVADLILKALYFRGDLLGHQIAEILRLPFNGVLDSVVEFLKREKLVEIMGSGGIGEASYRYAIATKGIERALDALQRTQYAGAAPVPLDMYIESINAQNRKDMLVKEEHMLAVMENLIVSKDMLDKIGPAANSGTSIFLYGPPGNGKTTLSEAIGRAILGDDMWVPYAV